MGSAQLAAVAPLAERPGAPLDEAGPPPCLALTSTLLTAMSALALGAALLPAVRRLVLS